jgi:alkaline phosphatase
MDWIGKNGGYGKNALYVTADHDHYLTLLPRKCDLRIHFILLRISNAQSCLISSSTD